MASLNEYRRKRDFKRTSEPSGSKSKKSKSKAQVKTEITSSERRFVIQKHAASRLHYDFRIELGGTLVSWAVPKGLPMKKGEKHLAIKVEDHPLSYEEFEGTIPKGEYGGGTVLLWDNGTYKPLHRAPLKELASGKLHFVLSGQKLQGEWYLVQLHHAEDDNQWLIIRADDDHPSIKRSIADRSVLSGRTMTQISKEVPTDKTPASAKVTEHTSQTLKHTSFDDDQFIEPMKALTREHAPTHTEGWTYEVKFDGYRIAAYIHPPSIHLITRNRNDLTLRFKEIADAFSDIKVKQAIIDGELVALDENGRSSFQLLQAQENQQDAPPLRFYAFDLLQLNHKSLLKLPIEERRKKLLSILPDQHPLIFYSKPLGSDADKLLVKAAQLGLEGLIGKRNASLYEPGQRSGAWIKLKILQQQEFVIGGYTEPSGSRHHFGALLIGVYDKNKLLCTGKVGTGFTDASLNELYEKMHKLSRKTCPFDNLPDDSSGRYGQGITASVMKKCHWIQPKLVCQIKFTEWTRDGRLRHPVYLGLRIDKPAREVIREPAPKAKTGR